MYIINTILKPNKYWGIYWCKVFWATLNWVVDVTDTFKDEFEYKDWTLRISFGSWTWYNRIKQKLQEDNPNAQLIYDISI